MGYWNITIEGTGAHHNKKHADDANRLAAEFVQKLRDAGHTVSHASFTHSGRDDIGAGAKYIETRDEIEKS